MNPLTWQNPEQLFVAQVLKKIFYNSVAELRFKLSLLKEVPNATAETIEDYWKVIFEIGKLTGKISKHVWFTIQRDIYDGYNIFNLYDNEYNKPNGEDL